MAARDDRAEGPEEDNQPGDGGPVEAARLVSEAAAELAQLSRRHGLDMLAHLLEMARLEADDMRRRTVDPKLN